MSTMLGEYEVDYAVLVYIDEEQTIERHRMILIPEGTLTLDSSHELWGDYISSALYPPRPHQASPWHTEWDAVNGVWLFNQATFTPFLLDQVAAYRDESIEDSSMVLKEFESEELGLRPDTRTLEAVGRKSFVAPLKDTDYSVKFKFTDFTPTGAGDAGYREVTTAFLQDFYVALDADNQLHYDAEEFVVSTHQVTPYTSLQDALDDFDDYLENA
jgi:hypothetical protein